MSSARRGLIGPGAANQAAVPPWAGCKVVAPLVVKRDLKITLLGLLRKHLGLSLLTQPPQVRTMAERQWNNINSQSPPSTKPQQTSRTCWRN